MEKKTIKPGPKNDEEALEILRDQAQKRVIPHESEPTTPLEIIRENIKKEGKVTEKSENESSA